MDLRGAVALVTGGGTGIGRAVAEALAAEGAAAVVIGYSRSAAEAADTVSVLEAVGCAAHAVRADVAAESESRAMVAEAADRHGRLDVLVNNAGTTFFVPHPDLDAVTDEMWDRVLGVNLKGTFYCSRAAAPHLRARRGAIVNVASIAGHRATGSSIPYAVSKAALLQLTRALAVALAPEIRVNSVSPGLVATRWFRAPFGDQVASAQEAEVAAATPLRAIPGPEHVAQAVVGLLRADLVTGEDVVVDGGRHLLY